MEDHVSDAQMRAARALVDWSVAVLAERSGVDRDAIASFESGRSGADPAVLARLRRALEGAGVEFIDGDAPGVRLRVGRQWSYIAPEHLSAENDD